MRSCCGSAWLPAGIPWPFGPQTRPELPLLGFSSPLQKDHLWVHLAECRGNFPFSPLLLYGPHCSFPVLAFSSPQVLRRSPWAFVTGKAYLVASGCLCLSLLLTPQEESPSPCVEGTGAPEGPRPVSHSKGGPDSVMTLDPWPQCWAPSGHSPLLGGQSLLLSEL